MRSARAGSFHDCASSSSSSISVLSRNEVVLRQVVSRPPVRYVVQIVIGDASTAQLPVTVPGIM
jgi:hypothetical protein